jgi:hypothetical protein
MLVNVFHSNYCWPPGFAEDENGQDNLFITDKSLADVYNAEQKAADLVNYVQLGASHSKSQHILLPWGCDFSY